MTVFYVNVAVSKGARADGSPSSTVVSRSSAQGGGVTVAVDTSLVTKQGQLRYALNAAYDHIMGSAADMGIV
jgi:hypothetical protein